MRIYSMTATFGKLEHQTLTLKQGLNVIQAPNEWGKSTWCAFLTAMLYGLDTRTHSTKTVLSDKERYAPWSGAPMSGRIELRWKGRDITIERKTRGRIPLGDFKAYETHSGLTVPELNGQNCGHMLLGVEKSVFTRSAMIRLTDLPVTQDEALRRRLNALVTTGDDSGAGDDLERRLRELKNRCRYNRSGLLPQAESEAAEVNRKLLELEELEHQSGKLRQRCADLEEQIKQLENHRTALRYKAARENAAKQEQAKQQLLLAEQSLRNLEGRCRQLPDRKYLEDALTRLQALQYRLAQLQTDHTLPDSEPDHSIFHGMSPMDARSKVAADTAQYKALMGWKPLLLVIALIAVLISACVFLLLPEHRYFSIFGFAVGMIVSIGWMFILLSGRRKAKKLSDIYGSTDPEEWSSMVNYYVNQFDEATTAKAQQLADITALREHMAALCADQSPAEATQNWNEALNSWDALERAEISYRQQKEHLDVLRTLMATGPAPLYPDRLNWTEEQTDTLLAEALRNLQESQHRLGQCQGQMEFIGYRTVLESRRNELNSRICQLEGTYKALTLALETLEKAREDLQRRFAPRISAHARELITRLTDGRYDRLVLGNDMILLATAAHEDVQRTTLWRSDGTADLLYLALRLAVAEELTPEAPLILDDALVRFDDLRLEKAMAVLKEESARRQIILFTCHSRESQYE